MMIAGILVFAAAAFLLSFLIGWSNDLDKGKVAVYVTLIAWGSVLYGLAIARISR